MNLLLGPTVLARHIVGSSTPGLSKVVQAADSYFAVLYDTREQRDEALGALGSRVFRVDGEEVPLTATKFGEDRSSRITAWTITVGA